MPAAHLTCVGASRAEIDGVVRGYWDAGIRHVVALRGDMKIAGAPYEAHPGGYQSDARTRRGDPAHRALRSERIVLSRASSRIRHRSRTTSRCSRPRSMPAPRAQSDNSASAQKPSRAFATAWHRGVSPFPSYRASCRPRISRAYRGWRCGQGASVPDWLTRLYDGLDEDLDSRKAIAAAILAEQVQQLRGHGFDCFHFYTLNQADLTYATCRLLGISPCAAARTSA